MKTVKISVGKKKGCIVKIMAIHPFADCAHISVMIYLFYMGEGRNLTNKSR